MAYKRCIIANNHPIQLLDKSLFVATTTVNGITFTNNGDGSYTVNGTSTASGKTWFNICNIGKNRFNGQNAYSAQINSAGIWGIDCTYSSSNGYVFYIVEAGETISSKKIYPQLIDLWATCGKANAPTTVAAAKAKFPNDVYPYNLSNIANSYKKIIKVADVCQLVNLETKTFTNNGITWAFNSDGAITINGQLTQDYSACYVTPKEKSQANHYYYAYSEGISASFPRYFTFYPQGFSATWVTDYADAGYIVKANESDKYLDFYYAVNSGNTTTYTDFVVHPQIIDLTETFGAGNEPQTVAEFRAKFPNSFYPYAPKCFVYTYDCKIKVADVCNLLDGSKLWDSETVNGVTFTNNGDGTFTLNGTSTNQTFKNLFQFSPKIGRTVAYPNSISNGLWGIDCAYDDWNGLCFYRCDAGITFNNQIIRPQLIDLWETFGKANAPTTVEAAKAKLPAESYPYAPKCFV